MNFIDKLNAKTFVEIIYRTVQKLFTLSNSYKGYYSCLIQYYVIYMKTNYRYIIKRAGTQLSLQK